MSINKIATLLMVLTVTLSIVGITYSHWSDTIRINGIVKMAHLKLTMISYKNLTSQEVQEYSNITSELSPDGHTLTLVCDGLKPCWLVWIGLVTQNQGSLPANLKPPEYSFDYPDGFEQYFETAEYFYGPYPENTGFGKLEVWKGSPPPVNVGDELLSDGNVTFSTEVTATSPPPFDPIPVEPGEKVVIWIWIHVPEDIPESLEGKTVTMYINIVDDAAI